MDLLEGLPEVLTADDFPGDGIPDLEVGDLIVFTWQKVSVTEAEIAWAEKRQKEDPSITIPTKVQRKVPCAYLRITSVGRNPRGKWIARFVACGTDQPLYMARAAGHVTDPRRSIDPDTPWQDTDPHPDQQRRDMDIRERRIKRQALVDERDAQRRRLMRTQSPISRRLIPAMISKLDRQIAEMDEPVRLNRAA
jgi:hypothetical protein